MSYRIAVVIQMLDWSFAYQGGAATHLLHILRGLEQAGHTVTVFVPTRDKRIQCGAIGLEGVYAPLGITNGPAFAMTERVARRAQTTLRLPWVQFFDSMRVLDAYNLQKGQFDLLYERNAMHGIGAALAHKAFGVPYVLHVDADFLYEHDFMGIPHTRLERLIALRTARFNGRAADAIVTVSNVTRQHLVESYGIAPDTIKVLPNGADLAPLPGEETLAGARRELGLVGKKVVAFIGNFHPWHDVAQLVRAFGRVASAAECATLLLVGDGSTRPRVAEQVAAAGLSGRVRFLGRVPHGQVPILLALSDVAVAPYPAMSQFTFWGSPMKLFEYMSAGKAIVASNCGEIGDILTDRHDALLVEPGDDAELAATIIELLRRPDLGRRLGEQAQRSWEQNYSWGSYTRRLERVFDEAVAKARMRRTRSSAMKPVSEKLRAY
jgi:glycosyltransferase involved in cell wall biosynthesis